MITPKIGTSRNMLILAANVPGNYYSDSIFNIPRLLSIKQTSVFNLSTTLASMIIACIFKSIGYFVCKYDVEQLISGVKCIPRSCVGRVCVMRTNIVLTGAVAVLSIFAAAARFQWLAAFFLVASPLVYTYLRKIQPKYSTQGYGVYSHDTEEKLQAPPQLKRNELLADKGSNFRDQQGRHVILRGVNLSGSSKFPIGNGTHVTDNFYQTDSISFVGRPFALADADDHFSRLRAWGFTFVRLLVTWEAVEHKGPREYDEEYLDYLLAIVRKARTHGISCLVDPHQDVWSRWTGGDGAPAWTLDCVGFDISSLHASGAAFTHQGYLAENGTSAILPRMTWPSNHHKLAAGTMFTLFFAGNDFAPDLKIGGVNIQDFLQGHYIAAMARVGVCFSFFFVPQVFFLTGLRVCLLQRRSWPWKITSWGSTRSTSPISA